MDRKIAFRVWHKEHGMIYPEEYFTIEDALLGNISFFGSPSEDFYVSDFTLMQCTGLKDKTGTEIFEGDVLFWNGWKGTVYWDQDFASWRAEHIGSLGGIPNLEIIGDIYQHPELITHKG